MAAMKPISAKTMQLIISTATISKEAKKARVIRNDIPIDIIDKSELSKRLIKLNFDVSFYQSKN